MWTTPSAQRPGTPHRVRIDLSATLFLFWIQSMVPDDGQRTLLFDLDATIQQLTGDAPGHPAPVRLTGIYHNLLLRRADT